MKSNYRLQKRTLKEREVKYMLPEKKYYYFTNLRYLYRVTTHHCIYRYILNLVAKHHQH